MFAKGMFGNLKLMFPTDTKKRQPSSNKSEASNKAFKHYFICEFSL